MVALCNYKGTLQHASWAYLLGEVVENGKDYEAAGRDMASMERK